MSVSKDGKRLDEKIEAWNNASNKYAELGCRKMEIDCELDILTREYNTKKCGLQNRLDDVKKSMEDVKARLAKMENE